MALPPNNIQRLFQAVGDPAVRGSVVGKGSVVSFHYMGQTKHRIHDAYPLVIVTDIFADQVRAINLHYLTLPYIKNLVATYGGNTNFSYSYIKGDEYIVGAFRSYKRTGISQLRMLDIGFLRNLLNVVRALDINEIEQMRQQIQRLMAEDKVVQPKAEPGPEMRPNG